MPGFLLKLAQSKESRSRLPATSERIPKRYKRASLTKLRSVPRCFKTDRDSLSLFKSSKRLREKLSSVQRDEFHEEMQSLQPGRASHSTEEHNRAKAVNQTIALSHLDPFLDDDRLLRIGGRLRHTDMSHAAKHPVILPRKAPVTNLIIAHCRQAVEHQVRGITHNRMRLSGYFPKSLLKLPRNVLHAMEWCFMLLLLLQHILMQFQLQKKFSSILLHLFNFFKYL